MAKTKAGLEAEIKELKSQLSDREKVEQFDKGASELRAIYKSYVNAGFTEEQAWNILVIQLNGAAKPKMSLF